MGKGVSPVRPCSGLQGYPPGPFMPYVGSFPSTSAHFLSTLFRGGEGGEKEGFEAGGFAAPLKPPGFP